jgi:hypothetical protein
VFLNTIGRLHRIVSQGNLPTGNAFQIFGQQLD